MKLRANVGRAVRWRERKKTNATSFPKAQLYDKSQEGEEQI